MSAVRTPIHSRAVRTRKRLVQAAEREFAESGYAGATARSIAERAGVATGSFYQYFEDKGALLRELASERQRDLTARLIGVYQQGVDPGEPQRPLSQMIRLVLDYHREEPELHAVISERRHADSELAELLERGERHLVQAIAAALQRHTGLRDPQATAFVLFGMVEGAIHAHVLGAPMVSDARFCTALVEGAARVVLGEVPAAPQDETST